MLLGLLLLLFTGAAHALTLESVDDSFGVPFGKPLQIEAFGVLENDILDGQSAGENGATARLLSGVSNGSLSCPTDTTVVLCADGSFDYTPESGFSGTDSFTYQAVSIGVVSKPATVTLTACTGGPDVFSCWQESSYLAMLAELGYGTFVEGFEGVAWDSVRSTFDTINSAPSIISQGITWTTNHPGTNEITTGTGPARTGMWGGYDPNHGHATGSFAECDVDTPPASCLFHDGLSGKILTGGDALHGVGGYITGFNGASISIILDGTTQIAIGKLPDSGHHFFGLIDARPAGFTSFEFRELDGKVGQEKFIFGDDFIIASSGVPGNTPPVANAGGPYTGVVDVNVMFDGAGSDDPDGTIMSYDWDFGDGATGTGPQPQHAYATTGTFTVTLTVTDNDGAISGPATTTATIDPANQAPTADPNGPYNGTVDVPLTFDGSGSTDPDGTIVAYDWDFGDGNTGTGVAPTHTYTTDGVFTLTLTVTDDGGLTGMATTTATIALGNQPPVADPNGPYTGTAASPVSFDGSASTDPDGTIVAYDWDFGDGTVLPDVGPTPTHTYAAAGLYNVTLTVTDNDGVSDSAGTTADIGAGNQPPVADPSGPYTGTAGLPVTFDGSGSTDPDGTIVAYDWDFGDGNTGTGVTPTHTYATDGVFTLTLTVTDDGGLTGMATTTATIGPVNQPPVANAGGPYTGVVDVNVMFDGTGSGDPDGTIMSYDWDFGDGATGTGPQSQHAYATIGTFTVTLRVTDNDGAISGPATTTATIDPANQAPTADPNGPYNGTVDVSLTFDGSGSTDPDGTIVAYDWDFGDGNTGTGVTPTHTYATDGVFTLTLTVTDDGGLTGTATTTATIALGNQPPVADPNGPYTGTAASPVTFDGSASSDPDGTIVAYDWDFGDGTVLPDAGPMPTHTYAAAGFYNVTLTVTDNDGVSDSAGTTADIQEVNTFSITKAEWRAKSKTLVVNGDGAVRHEFVTVTDADSATYVGTAKVVDKGKWKLRARRIQPVPCRVEAKWRDTLIVANVVNAPADCGPAL